ncbi:MAG: CoA transferase [Solirubrobacteraceae bacterium]|jgi:crotonobetainyl-CoA:carnitine CoA-transferase CaiB-like acyl-CoA transferase
MLNGLVALDLAGLPGQFTGRILADLGMRVIKVEPPGGDGARAVGPFKDDVADRDASLRFAFLNAGKESVTLDIESADGRDILLALAARVDVVIESYAPGYLAGLGLGHETLKLRNPGLIVASVTGFGQYGPRSAFAAPDIVAVATGGLMYISGAAGLPPVRPPETQGYYYGCVFAAYGVLLALYGRGSGGPGQAIDVSMQESIATQEHMIREAAFDGVAITRNGSQHKHTAPANIFACKDGHVFLFILGARDWGRLLALWPDHPPALDAEELRPPHHRRAHIDLINPLVEEFTSRYTKSELTTLLQEAGIPCLPVNSPSDFLAEEQVRSRDFLGEVSSPSLGTYAMLRFPALFDGVRPPAAQPPASCGKHNGEVYGGWLGMTARELELLAARGVI